MKTGIHPENYRYVVFKDISIDYAFLTKSCVDTKDTMGDFYFDASCNF